MTAREFVKDRLMRESERYADAAPDHFHFWEQHVKLVVREALLLADAYGADREIVELGALLHDIALVSEVGPRAEHHKNGKLLAAQILGECGYPEDRKRRVLGCVLHHRSGKLAENIEELCVADADILSHYDNIPMCVGSAFRRKAFDTESVAEWIRYFEQDWNDLSERTKATFRPRYETIMDVLFGALKE